MHIYVYIQVPNIMQAANVSQPPQRGACERRLVATLADLYQSAKI